jgi:ribosome-binding ATPase
MKTVGVVGLPYSGKSTLFTALTKTGGAGGRANQAVVGVPDERVDLLAAIERSRKKVAAQVRFVDVPGGLTAQGIGEFRQTDALCIVLRAFGPDAEPAKELTAVQTELVLADYSSMENGLDKARKRARSGPEAKVELAVIEAAHSLLEMERPLREQAWDESAAKVLRGYGPLTLKPWIVVANIDEGLVAGGVGRDWPEGAIPISAALEREVAGMDDAEAKEILEGFGVAERGLDRVIRGSYGALDLITFLTTGEDETRAWEVRRGATAPEAAGVIHSDLQRGFIRAEVVNFPALVDAGSWDDAKTKGLVRVEGKNYEVKEGDVLNVRFAV